MNSCNSCKAHFSVGCFAMCDAITTSFLATEAGVHIIRAWFNGAIFETEITIAQISDPIIIPGGTFNEDFETFFEIIMPSGGNYVHTVETVDYECFKAKTVIKF